MTTRAKFRSLSDPPPLVASAALPSTFGRRELTIGGAASLVLFGCAQGSDAAGSDGALDAGPPADSRADVTPGICTPTDTNLLGPFYKPGAPMRNVLAARTDGEWVVLTGRVMNNRCEPLANALLDVWHSDAADRGAIYDQAGFKYRGRFTADDTGEWKMESILPGHYLNGTYYRVGHYHFTISAPGHQSLTTQLSFQGDWAEPEDQLDKASLAIPRSKDLTGVWRADWTIVLRSNTGAQLTPAPRRQRAPQMKRRYFFARGVYRTA